MTLSTKEAFELWVPLARAYKAILSTVEHALKQAGLPGLDWYDVLWELEQADPDGLRPYELQDRLLLPQYGVSRLVLRLEKAGYLKRMSCDDDGRGQILVLTPQGAATRLRMWEVYAPALTKQINNPMMQVERHGLTGTLKQLELASKSGASE